MASLDKLFESFRKHTEEELEEATRASKEGVKLDTVPEQLEKYVSEKGEEPTHFIQFSNINKLGIYPSSDFRTPMGIYSYPLTRGILDQLKKGKLPFAQNRKFIIVFKKAPGSNILVNQSGAKTIDDAQYDRMIKQLFSEEAARLTMNSEFFEEANAYKHGFVFSQTIAGKLERSLDKPRPGINARSRLMDINSAKGKISELLEVMAEGFSAFIERRGGPFDATLERLRKDSHTDTPSPPLSAVWGVVYYIIQDWGSYPFGEVRSYEQIIDDYVAIMGRKRLREIRQDNYEFFKRRSHYYKDITSISQLPDIVFKNPSYPTSKERAHKQNRDEGVRRLKVYSKYQRELKDLKKLFQKKHYDILLQWLNGFLEYKAGKQQPATQTDAESFSFSSLNSSITFAMDTDIQKQLKKKAKSAKSKGKDYNPLEVIARYNKERLYLNAEVEHSNPESKSPEELTSIWKRIKIYSNNKSNLGKLWYGSMILAGNTENTDSKGPNRGMKVWRNILQGLWGIDGIVDLTDASEDRNWRSSYIIHSAEPTQAVFFSKSAVKQVTTLENTETPGKISKRKQGKTYKVKNIIKQHMIKEYDRLYADTLSLKRIPEEWRTAIFSDPAVSSPEQIRIAALRHFVNRFHSLARRGLPTISTLFEDIDYWKLVSSIEETERQVHPAIANHRRMMSLVIYDYWSKEYIRITNRKVRILMQLLNKNQTLAVTYALTERWKSKRFIEDAVKDLSALPQGISNAFHTIQSTSYDNVLSRPRGSNGMLESSKLIDQSEVLTELDEGVQLVYKKYKDSAKLFKAEIEEWRRRGQEKQEKGELITKQAGEDYRKVRDKIEKNFMITLAHLRQDVIDLHSHFNE